MDNRVYDQGAVATPPAAPATPSAGYPTDGDPLAPLPPTIPGAYWFHQVGEELRGVIAAAGLTPSDADLTQLLGALYKLFPQHGQCRLVKSGANLVLQPYNGNKLVINGVVETIPAAGVTLTPAALPAKAAGFTVTNLGAAAGVYTITTLAAHGLAVGDTGWIVLNTAPSGTPRLVFNFTVASVPNATSLTFSYGAATVASGAATGTGGPLLYVYAYMAAGAITLEAVPAGHATDATTGVEIKSGDTTRTLVGLCITPAAAFVDDVVNRYVKSWFNRQALAAYQCFQGTRTTASTTWAETNPADRANFLCWPGEITVGVAHVQGYTTGGVAETGQAAYGFDGTVALEEVVNVTVMGTNDIRDCTTTPDVSVGTEGVHYVSAFVRMTSAGSMSYYGAYSGVEVHGC